MNKLRMWQPVLIAVVALLAVLFILRGIVSLLMFNLYWLLPAFNLIFWGLLLVVHVLFMQGIYRDAASRKTTGRKLYFVAPEAWALATLVGGFFVVALYWVLHHSMLQRD